MTDKLLTKILKIVLIVAGLVVIFERVTILVLIIKAFGVGR